MTTETATEACGCGATITLGSVSSAVLSMKLTAWRTEHRHDVSPNQKSISRERSPS